MARLACTTFLLFLLFTAKFALSSTPPGKIDKQLIAAHTAAIPSIRTTQTSTNVESSPLVLTTSTHETGLATNEPAESATSSCGVHDCMKVASLLSTSTTDASPITTMPWASSAHSNVGATTNTHELTSSVQKTQADSDSSTTTAATQSLKRKRLTGPVELSEGSGSNSSSKVTTPTVLSSTIKPSGTSKKLPPRQIVPIPQLPMDYSQRDPSINDSWLASYSSSPMGLNILKNTMNVMIFGRHVASLFSAVGLLLKYSPTYDDILLEIFKSLQSRREMEIYRQLCLAYRNEGDKLSLLLLANLHAQPSIELAILFFPLYILHPARTLEFYINYITHTIAHWEDAEFARYIYIIGDLAITQSFMEIMIVNLAKAHKPTFVLQAAQKMTDHSRRNQLVSSCIYFAAVNDCFSCMQAYKSYLPNVVFGTFDVRDLLGDPCYSTTSTSVFYSSHNSCSPSDAPCIPLVTGLDLSNEVRSAIDGNVVDNYKSALGKRFVSTNAEFDCQTMYALSRGSFSILEYIYSIKETSDCSNSVATAKTLFIHCLKLKIYGRRVISLRFTHNPLMWLLDSILSSESWNAHFQEIVQSATEEIYTKQPELKPALHLFLKQYSVLRDALKEPAAIESRRILMAEILREVQMAPAETAITTTTH